MLLIEQNASNSLTFTLSSRVEEGQYYLLEFTSIVTKETYSVFPVLESSNRRFVKLNINTDNDSDPDPYVGTVMLNPPGSWSYRIYIADEFNVDTLEKVLLEEGYAKVEPSCEETQPYVFYSNNETARSVVFSSKTCFICQTWDTSSVWNLDNQLWNCED